MIQISLAGKVAIVTGAGSGIGRGIALGLSEAGASVAVADVNLDAASETVAMIAGKEHARGLAVHVDVVSAESVRSMVERVMAELGGVDILVNNAGIAPSWPLVDFPEEEWDKTVAVNLKGYFLCAREAAQQMIKQGRGGSLINISSKSGVRGSPDNSAYNATKFGVIGMAQGWARELARHNIRVNSVLPGNVIRGSGIWNADYIAARAKQAGIAPEDVEEFYTHKVPLGRQCEPRDVANMVVFLASELASYITGCSHLVDGGQEMRI